MEVPVRWNIARGFFQQEQLNYAQSQYYGTVILSPSLYIYIHIYAAQSITRSAFISIIYLSLNSIAPAASLYNCETI